MRRHDRSFVLSCSAALALAACASASPRAPLPDAAQPLVPRSPAGTFAVTSELDLPLPAAATAAFAPLVAATDGPDDPSRYLLDRLVDQLPDGTLQTIARESVPLLASYLNARLAEVAPNLTTGLRTLAAGLERVARHVGMLETWQIDARGAATVVISGIQLDVAATPVVLRFSDHGLDDRVASTQVTIGRDGRLSVGDHRVTLGYSSVLRLGFDHAVIPQVDPGATDLATALGDLVDCEQLADLVSYQLGIGSPALYRAACLAATASLANDVYARLAAIDADTPLLLELEGAAQPVDRDGDGTMDEIRSGTWSGQLSPAGPLGLATFSGSAAR